MEQLSGGVCCDICGTFFNIVILSVYSWEYMTMSYDIGFGIFRKPEGMKNRKLHAGDMIVVVSLEDVCVHVRHCFCFVAAAFYSAD